MNLLAAGTLVRREFVRFMRSKSRMIGVIVSPILFWAVIGSGLNKSFQQTEHGISTTYLEYFYPGSVVLVLFFGAIFSSISVIEDRREGFLQSVLVAPISRASIAAGKIGGIALLSLIQTIPFLAFSPLIIPDVTIGSSLLTLSVLLLLAVGLSSFGFAIAWSVDSTQGFHAVMNLLLVPMWMLSGALFPASGATSWIATIMRWNPLTYGVAAVRTSLYGLIPSSSQGLPEYELSLAVLVLFALAAALSAVWKVTVREKGAPVTQQERHNDNNG